MPNRLKRNRCKECPGCLATDCGECRACKDLPKFGGPGKSHACCIQRLCHVLYPEIGKEGRRIREYPRNRQSGTPASPQPRPPPPPASQTSAGTAATDSPAPPSVAVESPPPPPPPPPKSPSPKSPSPPASPPATSPSPPTPPSELQQQLPRMQQPQQKQPHQEPEQKQPQQRQQQQQQLSPVKPPPLENSDVSSSTPRPKRKRVEPKRIQDLVEPPQWGHRHQKQQKPSPAAAPALAAALQQRPPPHGVDAKTNHGPNDHHPNRYATKRSSSSGNYNHHHEEVTAVARVRAPRLSSMKHGTTDLDTVKNSSLGLSEAPPIEVPTPTLAEYVDAKIAAAAAVQQQGTTSMPPPADFTSHDQEELEMYGYKVPDAPPENTCAGCLGRRDVELEDNPIVLCDGEGCGREYHLNCCNPALSDEKEQENWLCQDCCPNGGSTAFLFRYLEESDERKAEFLAQSTASDPHAAFIDYLLRQDTKREHKRLDRFPVSQLERGALTDATARADTVSRTRRGQEQALPLTPDFFIGKPVRIFSLVGSQYHTGRIVDCRIATKTTTPGPHSINDFEFLIRFPAGVEGRKTAYRHWIVLEEHGTCVGTTLVWALMPSGGWQPSIVWLRTARELIPIQHHLIESEGQIQYRSAHHHGAHHDKDDESLVTKKSKFKVLALIRPFGHVSVFHTLNAKDKMMDLFHETAVKEFLNDGKTMLQFEMAQTEHNEQIKVRQWRELKLQDPMGYYALSSADAYALPLLQPSLYGQVSLESHAALCPTVRRGLDRNKLVAQLQRRGVAVSKDLGAAMSCKLTAFHPHMFWDNDDDDKSPKTADQSSNGVLTNGHGPTSDRVTMNGKAFADTAVVNSS